MNKIALNIAIKKIELKGFIKLIMHSFQNKPESKVVCDVKKSENIKASVKVVDRSDCIGCGLCSSVCAFDAVEMKRDSLGFIPVVNDDKCINCGLCLRECPGINKLQYEGELGHIKKMYVAHAKDENIRYEASSGGACRLILKKLLEDGVVDKVIITRATEDPYNPETIITSSPDDIFNNKVNSIYSPVKPLAGLKELDKNLKYAFVGLPCHIAGLELNKKFKKNIVFKIGLFCSHTPGFQFVDSLIADTNLSGEISRIRYRGEGWPGKSSLYLKDGREYKIAFPALWHEYNYKRSYEQPRCAKCTYYSAEFADVSLGDPWVLAGSDHSGSSLIFARTERAVDLVNNMDEFMEMYEPEGDTKDKILKFHYESIRAKLKNKE